MLLLYLRDSYNEIVIFYQFLNEDDRSLFEVKLATLILTDNAHQLLENETFMGKKKITKKSNNKTLSRIRFFIS